MSRKKSIEVQAGRFGRPVETLEMSEGDTIEDALEEAGLKVRSTESVTLNGDSTDISEELQDDDVIILTRNVEGGR